MSLNFEIPFGGRGGGYTIEELDLIREVASQKAPLTQGIHLKKFQEDFLLFQNSSGFTFATSSCTGALEIIAELLSSLPGSEIIVPSHTYTSSVYPFVKRGLRPIWSDLDPITRVITPDLIAPLISSQTKAILVPHLYGYVADATAIQSLARENNIILIEDAAQSIGSRLNGHRSGSIADFGVFSFHSHKNLTTLGEGGMLWVKNPDHAKLVPLLRHNGHCSFEFERDAYWLPAMGNVDLPAIKNHPLNVGNYCLGEVQSALGSKLLKRIDEVNNLKRKRAIRIIDELKDNSILTFHRENSERHNYHLLAATVSRGLRDSFIRRMANYHKIQCAIQYQPLHRYDYYKKLGFGKANTPQSEKFYDNMVSFPFHQSLTEDDMSRILSATKETLECLAS